MYCQRAKIPIDQIMPRVRCQLMVFLLLDGHCHFQIYGHAMTEVSGFVDNSVFIGLRDCKFSDEKP